MAATITRPTFLLTSRVWPTWIPEAIVEAERRTFQSNLHQQSKPSFQFSACLQSLFSLQDSILGVQNPLNFQHARNFSQSQRPRSLTAPAPQRAVIGARSRALTLPAPGSQLRAEHTSARLPKMAPANNAHLSLRTREDARAKKYEAMKSRILSVL